MELHPRLRGDLSELVIRQRQRWSRLPGNVRGALFASLAACLYSSLLALVKLAGQTLHITEVLFFRQAVILLFVAPSILRNFPGALRTQRLDLQALRVAAAAIAMLLSFTAVLHLPLADATTIGFARSFFITIFAILLLGEVVGPRRWLAIVVGFAGVVVVMQPEGLGSFDAYGAMRLAGAATAGFVMVILRMLTRVDRPVTIMSYQALGIGLLMLAPALWFWRTPSLYELGLLLLIGGISVLTQTCNILAFRAAEASAIAPFDYLRLLFAILLGVLIFAEWPEAHVLLGAAVIIAAALYTLQRERRLARRARANRRDAAT